MTIAFSASNHAAGFVRTDLQILKTIGEVALLPEGHLPLVWKKLDPVARASLVYGWFADLPNLDTGILCRILRKPFVLAVGGYELANFPEFQYGLQRRSLTRLVVRKCFDSATALLFLHPSLLEEASRFHPRAQAKMQTVRAGFDGSFWTFRVDAERKGVATILAADTLARFLIKGGPRVFEVARSFPDREFLVVGVWPHLLNRLRNEAPSNVRIVPPASPEHIRQILQETSVYLQFSVREVFPNSVCEAMLCGAIPVTSSLPVFGEVVGDVGFVVADSEAASFVAAVEEALERAETLRVRARQRILAVYPAETRAKKVREVLAAVTS